MEMKTMSFIVMTDSSANLPRKTLEDYKIEIIPFHYYIDGKPYECLDLADFDGDDFYNKIRAGLQVTTSLITPQDYMDYFSPHLKAGNDLIFIAMASGISGSYNAAEIAVKDLKEEFPERKMIVIDSLGASLGQGLIALYAADYRDEGLSIDETAEKCREHVRCMFQVFTVDDLMHLRRGGRLSNLSAIVGTVLNIKPLLKGSSDGHIVAFKKIRGRRHSIEALAKKYDELAVHPENQIIGIAQAGCKEETAYLESLLRKNRPPKEILTVEYEPVTGSHVGPGALALFFQGGPDVRENV